MCHSSPRRKSPPRTGPLKTCTGRASSTYGLAGQQYILPVLVSWRLDWTIEVCFRNRATPTRNRRAVADRAMIELRRPPHRARTTNQSIKEQEQRCEWACSHAGRAQVGSTHLRGRVESGGVSLPSSSLRCSFENDACKVSIFPAVPDRQVASASASTTVPPQI